MSTPYDLDDETRLKKTLRKVGDPGQIRLYAAQVARTLEGLHLDGQDTRICCSVSIGSRRAIPVTLGKRYIFSLFKVFDEWRFEIIYPRTHQADLDEFCLNFYEFARPSDSLLVAVDNLHPLTDPTVYSRFMAQCKTELERMKRSNFRPYHSAVAYQFYADLEYREDLLSRTFQENVDE